MLKVRNPLRAENRPLSRHSVPCPCDFTCGKRRILHGAIFKTGKYSRNGAVCTGGGIRERGITIMAGNKSCRCSFCGRSKNIEYMIRSCEDGKKAAGQTVYICDECVSQCNKILKGLYKKDGRQYAWDLVKVPEKEKLEGKASTPHEIRAVLDRYVIGQGKAKKVLAVAVHNRRKRLMGNRRIRKSNILQRLLDAAGGDVKKAQQGIVYLDKFDKLGQRAASGARGDIGGKGVQQELLKIIERAVVRLRQGMNPMNPMTRIGMQMEIPPILFEMYPMTRELVKPTLKMQGI